MIPAFELNEIVREARVRRGVQPPLNPTTGFIGSRETASSFVRSATYACLMADTDSQWYTTVPARLEKLLTEIPKLGTPDKANSRWLASIGFGGGNDQSMVRVLKTAGMIDGQGAPTTAWNSFKGGDKRAFADGIRAGYSALFAIHPDAQQKDAEALIAFFRTNTRLGEAAQKLCVSTFQTLVKFADFAVQRQTQPTRPASVEREVAAEPGHRPSAPARSAGGNLGLTVNVQLQLPPSADGEVYDKLFAAMAKHLRGLLDSG
jgi:hypothetical protein